MANATINEARMHSKFRFCIELAVKGGGVSLCLILLRQLFTRTFGNYAIQALGFIDLGIAFAFLLFIIGMGITAWSLFRIRK